MSRPARSVKSLLSLNSRGSPVASRPVTGRQEVRCGTKFSDHLNGVFSGLQFPPELARRILTHANHQTATNGHNASLSFIGMPRSRSRSCGLIAHSSALTPEHDLEDIAYHTLHTYALGEHVGSKWGLGRHLRWVPAIAPEVREQVSDSPDLRKVGLYKVQGDAVTAVVGGIFSQFGGFVAHRVFHTRLLLPMLVKGALHEAFHRDALLVCDRMGGPEGRLVIKSSSTFS
ncbi:uncharacterized protein LACBIDRAFT_313754 [Laccaria bicolor S238N-H82]|uniref:Predicted protein n=1 Tax=Laccaria bicolor (strain S238N-H82 / ATCC MYA-4686) TaxID=486041 RepID=B0D0R8_LACBS|nr:uncharacterized protein LACBIDRAFT_313754 [Laccaria bicolor S238N-H82]EDR11868.1 predicted protein [Laccaria bicolor S238N-H82]|eukprot:XP_001877765.1 predicted protein [Laccaria bicolor S238N-H82]